MQKKGVRGMPVFKLDIAPVGRPEDAEEAALNQRKKRQSHNKKLKALRDKRDNAVRIEERKKLVEAEETLPWDLAPQPQSELSEEPTTTISETEELFDTPLIEAQQSETGETQENSSVAPQKEMEKGTEINVKLHYRIDTQAATSAMLMEIVEGRLYDIDIASRDIDYWWKVMNTVGANKFCDVFKDMDRYHMLIYAAEFIRANQSKEAEQRNIGELPVTNPEYNPYKENVEQDGRSWGIKFDGPAVPVKEMPKLAPVQTLSEEAVKLMQDTSLASRVSPPATIKQQVEEKEKESVAWFKDLQKESLAYGEEVLANELARSSYNEKWELAAEWARQPRPTWEHAPFEMVKMVEWCVGWLKDTGEIPDFPHDLLEIWWTRPNASVINDSPEAVLRRDAIVEKIRKYWQKSVEQYKDTVNLQSQSYRVTLAAMQLERLIEQYANGNEVEDAIKQVAQKYFFAHIPIENLGVKPGPESTLDPDYLSYVKLCQKYNLQIGTMLHEASL